MLNCFEIPFRLQTCKHVICTQILPGDAQNTVMEMLSKGKVQPVALQYRSNHHSKHAGS